MCTSKKKNDHPSAGKDYMYLGFHASINVPAPYPAAEQDSFELHSRFATRETQEKCILGNKAREKQGE